MYHGTYHGDAGFISFKKIARGVSSVARAVAKPAAAIANSPIGRVALTGARFIPGAGSAVGAAEAALRGVARGDSLTKLATAAAIGAAPPGVAAAVDAASRLARGEPVLRTALGAAVSALPPGTPARQGAEVAAAILRRGKVAPAALGAARNALSGPARAGFDAAVGSLASASKAAPLRPFTAPHAVLRRSAPAVLSRMHPTTSLVRNALKRSPWLAARDAGAIAETLSVPRAAVRDALAMGPVGLRWAPANRRTAAFLRKLAPHVSPAAFDTGALPNVPATHTLKSGEFPAALAAKYTGSSNKWKEFPSANPGMKEVHTKDSSGKVTWSGLSPWNVGQVVTIPPAWRGDAPATSSSMTTAAMLKAKATLAAWGKTDGANYAGLTDYGQTIGDALPDWGPRDKLMAKSFATREHLPDQSGELTQQLVSALDAWAAQKAASLPVEPVLPQAPVSIPGVAPDPGAVQDPIASTSPGQPVAWSPPPDPAAPIDPWAILTQGASAAQAAASALPTAPVTVAAEQPTPAAAAASAAPGAGANPKKADDGGGLVIGALAAAALMTVL